MDHLSNKAGSPRKIIHVDMDAFYAAVETLDRPELAHVPLVVGGPPQSRSVVSTANYEARKYGIRSAMACSIAYRLCPKAVFVPPRFSRYSEISRQIVAIFERYTPDVETLSLDEAYLDVTQHCGELYASTIARKIKEDVFRETGLTCSAGVAPNKLVAKIASEFNKPNGLKVVPPQDVESFMAPLPVRKIHGVGPATEKRLNALGIKTCSDIRNIDFAVLEAQMGRWAEWLLDAAYGRDERLVESSWERKSFGREDTFAKDLYQLSVMDQKLTELAEQLAKDLKRADHSGRTITLKVKYHDFQTVTRSKTQTSPTRDAHEIFTVVRELLHQRTEASGRAVRLLGISMSKLV